MKCLECDAILTDKEATRKSKQTGEFLDICDECLGEEFLIMEMAVEGKMYEDSR